MTGKLTYLIGDATCPQGPGNKIICHTCNDLGKWGAGFVLAVSKKWKDPETAYRTWAATFAPDRLPLGKVQFVQVEDNIVVANMIGQHGIGWSAGGIPPVRYDRVRQCLLAVAQKAKELNAVVCGPRFCAGLSGGHWKTIEGLIEETLLAEGIDVFIYDLPAPVSKPYTGTTYDPTDGYDRP